MAGAHSHRNASSAGNIRFAHCRLVAGFCFVLGSIVCRILGQGLLWFPSPMAGAIGAVLGGGLYAPLAGLTIPTQRAFVMVATVMTAVLLGRSVDIVRCLAIALILILVVDPLSVLDAGLWMSFGAVAAILAASKATTDTGNRILRVIKIQLILTLLMAPLVLVFFGQVSLVAPVAEPDSDTRSRIYRGASGTVCLRVARIRLARTGRGSVLACEWHIEWVVLLAFRALRT